MKTVLMVLGFMMANAIPAKENLSLLLYKDVLARKPDSTGKNVRIWNIRRTDTLRINLVEFTGELGLHKHPDADHSLMVLEGKVRVLIGQDKFEIEKGDFVSVPKDIPHKYWTVSEKAMLVSMDAPYYDPKKTIPLE